MPLFSPLLSFPTWEIQLAKNKFTKRGTTGGGGLGDKISITLSPLDQTHMPQALPSPPEPYVLSGCEIVL